MGGQAALDGFLKQAIVALVGAATIDDWTQFEVEPNIADEAVDIRWTLADGSLRVMQVKVRTSVFTPKQVRDWGKVLSKVVAASRELVLLGHASEAAQKVKVSGVDIRFEGPQIDRHAFQTMAQYLLTVGCNLSASELPYVLEHVLARIFHGSVTGDTWTRDKLKALALQAVELAKPQLIQESELRVVANRTIVVDRYQVVHDVCAYTISNPTGSVSQPAEFRIRWTDSAGDTIEHYGPADGLAERSEELAVLWVRFAVPELAPGESWKCAGVARRPSLVHPNQAGESYSDPINPHQSAWPLDLTIVCLRSSNWDKVSEPIRPVNAQVARYRGTMPSAQTLVALSWLPDSGVLTPSSEAVAALQEAERHAGHIGLSTRWLSG